MKIINKFKIKIKDISMMLFTFFLFYFSSLFQIIPIKLFNLNTKSISSSTGIILITFSNFCLLLLLLFIYRKEIKKEWFIFKNNLDSNIDTGIKCWLVGLCAMMFSNIIISLVFGSGNAANEETVQKMIHTLPWLMLLNAGIIAPINEEIVFRKSFKNVFKNKWLFVFMSGFIFGLLHVIGNMNSLKDFLYIIPYGSLGSAFAYAYYKTDTIYTSTSLHIIHNLVLIIKSII